MKSRITSYFIRITCIAIMMAGQCAWAEEVAFDRGGVSVDFLAADKKRQAGGSAIKKVLFRENVETIDPKTGLPPEWLRGFNVFSIHPEEDKQLTELISPLCTQKISTENGKRFFTLQTNKKAQALRAKYTKNSSKVKPDFCGSIQRWIALPEPYQTRKLRIRFKYRGVVPEGMDGLNILLIQGYSADRKDFPWRGGRVDYKQARLSRFNGQWQEGEMTMLCTEPARSVGFGLKNYGCSKVDIADIVVEEIKKDDEGLSIYLTPQFFTDNLYCMAVGEPSILKFTQLNEANVEVKNPMIVLELPQEVEVTDARNLLTISTKKAMLRNGKPYVQYRYAMGGLKGYIKHDTLNHYTSSFFLLQSSLEAGDTLYPASYWVEDGDYASTPNSFDLKIIEPVNSLRPVKFETGTVTNREFDFRSPSKMQMLVDLYASKGFNVIHTGGAPKEVLEMFQKKGIKRYTQPTSWLANGYRIGTGEKPDDVRFQFVDGTYHERGICPVAVYQPGEYFRDHVEAPLRKLLVEDRLADGIMSNWEPYMFNFKGCFCSRCKLGFGKYAKLEKAELDQDWPNEIITKHRPIWIKFRAWQHGQLMRMLEKTVYRIGKEADLDAHFIPEIATLSLSNEGRNHFEQVDPLEYIDSLKFIEPWGPYVGNFKYPGRYTYYTGDHLTMETKTREVREYVAKHIPDVKKRPRLIGFPHASQGTFGMADPEGIAFDTLCMFVNGWQGALAYHFPDGFDARYWNALATANQAINRFENQVMDGVSQPRHQLDILTPLPKPCLSPAGKTYRMDTNVSLVFSREFTYKKQRLLAIGNTWKYGDAFVRLSLNDVPSDKKFVLHKPLTGRCYTNEDGKVALSASELSEGIILHAGALRFAFFLLEPYEAGKDYGQAIRPAEMIAMQAAYRPDIEKAIEFEKRYQGQPVK